MSRRSSRLGIIALMVGALLFVGAPTSSQAHSQGAAWASLDLTASAIPAKAGSRVADATMNRVASAHRKVKADATANASATCEGCAGNASTLQVLYLNGPPVAILDNVATASSQCAQCRATAISVQVVVVRHAPHLTANNRALAVNAECDGCTSAAVAYQLVVAGTSNRQLTRAEYDELKTWVAEQSAILAGGGVAQRSALPESARGAANLDALTDLVNDKLGSTTLAAHVDTQTK